MGNPSLGPEVALQLFHVLLYCMAYIFAGAALIGLSVYIALACLEMFFSQPRSKDRLPKVPRPVGFVPVAEESLDLSAAETRIAIEAVRPGEEAVRMPDLPHDVQTRLILGPVTLESEPTGL
jgi:hypothetical protein